MGTLSMSLMGTVEVTQDGVPVTFATDKALALLIYLAMQAARSHRRDTLAGLLWPDQPRRKARQSLRQAFRHIRRALDGEDDALLVNRHSAQFNAHSDHYLDVVEFTTLWETCRRHRHRRLGGCLPCLRRVQRMVTLYRGDFLAGFSLGDSAPFEEWAILTRESLHRQMMEALGVLADYHELRGERDRARQYVRRQIAMEPWREESHRRLMRLLASNGKRNAALSQYERFRRILMADLNVEPTGETQALFEQIRAGTLSAVVGAPRVVMPSSGPPLVAREKELAEIAELLASPDSRLITLTGPGGIGKTHLALEVAARHVGLFADGVVFVPLAALSSPDELLPTLARSLDVAVDESHDLGVQVRRHLRPRELLLVLDNLEHLLEAVVLLAELLRDAPNLTILATSRERLRLRDEWVYELEGLTYPSSPVPGFETWGAVTLFARLARQVHDGFDLDEAAQAVVHICNLVEGMPLALELAAAWVGTRSCALIAEELADGLTELRSPLRDVPPRQLSLKASFDHSWMLLSPQEREAFARLSVFRGGFDRAAAEEVTDAPLERIEALVTKSLLRRDGPGRYEMHELLRQYAAGHLANAPGLLVETEARHARLFADRLAELAPRLGGAEQSTALKEMADDLENMRRAWEWAVEHGDGELASRCLESLYLYHRAYGLFEEGTALLRPAASRWQDEAGQEGLWGRIRARQGALDYHRGRYDRARAALEAALEVSTRQGDRGEQQFALLFLARVALRQGRPEEAADLTARGLSLARQSGSADDASRALYLLSLLRYRAGDAEAARKLLAESLSLAQTTGNPRLMLASLNLQADLACHLGDYDEARRTFEECLSLSRELGDRFRSAILLNNLGTVLHQQGEYAAARPCYEQSLALCCEIGDRAGQAIALSNLGEVAFALGDYVRARRAYLRGLAIGRELEDTWAILACLTNLGEVACAGGECAEAREYLVEALELAVRTDTLTVTLKVLVNLGRLLIAQGEPERAAELFALVATHPGGEQGAQEQAARMLAEMGVSAPSSVRSVEEVVADWVNDAPA